ncbi:45 kDa calcium-binding protein [Copidosoma floridanum]|uniref:45 kDa calcium-binding protein n=1 Tax=Copidosoma floridanum TaxID=29053 RepID=UPI0006C94950|nr:45 kDa calcium-binding protein [Copidosoma floridanum]
MTRLRFPRAAILLALTIYACLLVVYYRHSMPLKNDEPTDDPVQSNDRSGVNIEELLNELSDDDSGNSDTRDEQRVRLSASEDSRKLLETIFWKADTDKDDFLDIRELAKWIHAKIIDHIDRSMRDNIGLFTSIDSNPRNGEISWDEYHAHFLRSNGLSEDYIDSYNERHLELSRSQKEAVVRDRARWSEAARNDPDKLTLDEFLAFTHPESSHRALLQMVEDLFDKFDRDGDEQLTEDEFSDLPSEGVNVEPSVSMPVRQERRQEFRHLIDKNKNGKADRSELLAYIDPRNPRHAIQEANHLIELSDVNHDGKLQLSEVLSKTDLFLGSKMVDTEGSFHDEFR